MPTTGKYNLIKIGSIYLTTDGTITGKPCRTEVTGLDAMRSNYTGNTVIALSGMPYNQIFQNTLKGLFFTIKVFQTLDTRLDSLFTLLGTMLSGSTTVQVDIEGDTGDFSVNCLPAYRGDTPPIGFTGAFQSNQIKDITINFVIESVV